jgi:hypothetical protein
MSPQKKNYNILHLYQKLREKKYKYIYIYIYMVTHMLQPS